jgi:TRAP-type transport system small permease protein
MKWIDAAADFLNRLAAGMLFAMMLVTMADVLLRKLFNRGILGALELTEFMMAIVVFFALARTEWQDRNVYVDLVMERFGRRIQLCTAILTRAICFLFCSFVTASAIVYGNAIRASGEVSLDLWLPKYPFVYAVAAAWAVLALVLLMRCLTVFREIRTSWNP